MFLHPLLFFFCKHFLIFSVKFPSLNVFFHYQFLQVLYKTHHLSGVLLINYGQVFFYFCFLSSNDRCESLFDLWCFSKKDHQEVIFSLPRSWKENLSSRKDFPLIEANLLLTTTIFSVLNSFLFLLRSPFFFLFLNRQI